jgi:hypothetical protein
MVYQKKTSMDEDYGFPHFRIGQQDLSTKKSKEPVFAPGMNSTPGVAGRMCWIYLFWVGNFFGAAAEFRG